MLSVHQRDTRRRGGVCRRDDKPDAAAARKGSATTIATSRVGLSDGGPASTGSAARSSCTAGGGWWAPPRAVSGELEPKIAPRPWEICCHKRAAPHAVAQNGGATSSVLIPANAPAAGPRPLPHPSPTQRPVRPCTCGLDASEATGPDSGSKSTSGGAGEPSILGLDAPHILLVGARRGKGAFAERSQPAGRLLFRLRHAARWLPERCSAERVCGGVRP